MIVVFVKAAKVDDSGKSGTGAITVLFYDLFKP